MKFVRVISFALIAWGVVRSLLKFDDFIFHPLSYIFWGLIPIVAGIFLLRLNSAKHNSNGGSGSEARDVQGNHLSSKQDYFHEFDKTYIGVNKTDKTLTLKDGKIVKVYSFSDVRTWEKRHQTGGAIGGGGMAYVAASFDAARDNKNKSGLFIEVKDIDHPLWQVKFRMDKTIDKELAKWMEILRQSINND